MMARKRPIKKASRARDGAAILDDLVKFIRRYMVCSDAQADAIALWTLHTHATDAAETTPYLAVTSAAKQSGKSRLFEVISLAVARPWTAVEPSEAVLFRKIAKERPTLLLDELDAIFGPKSPNREALRGLLNAGNRRGAAVPRCVGEGTKMDVVDFPVFCPKAFAAIGELPDTLADRSIRIRLKRKTRHEQVAPFRRRDAEREGTALRSRCGRWAAGQIEHLRDVEPELPSELSDRAAEGWEPLLAIAGRAGGTWPERAKTAAVALSAPGLEQERSAHIQLLEDVRQIFAGRETSRITTERLIKRLKRIEDSPWAEWHGRGLTAHALGRLLAQFEIRPRAFRAKEGVRRGYDRSQFQDAFERYLSPFPSDAARKRNKRNRL